MALRSLDGRTLRDRNGCLVAILVGVSLCLVQTRRFFIPDDAAAANRDIARFEDGKIESQLLQAKNTATDAYSTALSAAATLALATGSLGAPPQ
jgi:hypothetical protein